MYVFFEFDGARSQLRLRGYLNCTFQPVPSLDKGGGLLKCTHTYICVCICVCLLTYEHLNLVDLLVGNSTVFLQFIQVIVS